MSISINFCKVILIQLKKKPKNCVLRVNHGGMTKDKDWENGKEIEVWSGWFSRYKRDSCGERVREKT